MPEKWRIFQATNFPSLIRPSITVCRAYGLVSCKIVDNKYIEQSRVGQVYCALITFLHIALSFILLYFINVSPFLNGVSTWILQGNCFYAITNFIVISNCAFGSSAMKILQYLTRTADKLPPGNFVRMAKRIYPVYFVMYFLLLIHTPKVFTGEILIKITKVYLTYANSSVIMLDFQYSTYVYVIANCFKHINDELYELKNNLLNQEAHLLRRVYHNQFNPLLFMKLRYLKQWHYELNEIIRKLNSTFSLQIVGTVVMTFTELTFGLYFYIYDVRHKRERTTDKECWYYYYQTTIIYYAVKMLFLTLICQSANDENLKTRTIVNEIMINTDDKFFKDELHMFSLQLLHMNNVFIAKGVQLDAGLLTTISKGIFTYILVLIQFSSSNNH